ncbi:ribonuclease Y [Candidatus Peregrinibacteria bacterium]|nr:MAG: ribonuclease Y [Candidatus Peregrinibacteria bacterium]
MTAFLWILLGAGVGGGAAFFILSQKNDQNRLIEEKKLLEVQQKIIRTEGEVREKEMKAKEILFQAENSAKTVKQEAQASIQEQKNNVDKDRVRVEQKEQHLEKQEKSLDQKFKGFEELEEKVKEERKSIKEALEAQKEKLAEIAELTQEEARAKLMKQVEEDSKNILLRQIMKGEADVKAAADLKAKNIICHAIQRFAGEVASEKTSSVVHIPNDDMKGRIIGREGRNINSIEHATGVDVIIDDTPNAITISGFDPSRRHVAKLLIEKLVEDGRIHPARIEELAEKCREETNDLIKELGEKTLFELGINGIHPELVRILGRLHFRTSYGQNQLKHAIEVSFICKYLAAQVGVDEHKAQIAGLFHDVGKAIDHEIEGGHAVIGHEVLTKYGVEEEISYAVGSHHEDMPIDTPLGFIVCAADAISGARPGARRENFEAYIKRLKELEAVATSFPGVKQVYAIQAGREIRVMVNPNKLDDYGTKKLAMDIAAKVEKDLTYPGQIKIHVVREKKEITFAK